MNEDEVNEDQEEETRSLGAYENMERSSIRPSFYSGRSGEDSKEKSRTTNAKNTLGDAERNAAKEGAKKFASTLIKRGADAATGGTGGKAIEAAEKASKKIGLDKKAGGSSFIGKIALVGAPIIIVGLVLIIFCFAFLPFLQWLFPWGYQARMLEENNTTQVSAQAYSDNLLNSSQLNNCNNKSTVADVSYNDMSFTELQVEELEQAGLTVRQFDNCSTALIYQDEGGNDVAVVSSNSLSRSPDGALADDDSTLVDGGTESDSDATRRSEIIAQLNLAAESSSVKTLSEAMNDYYFRDRYKRGSEYWRGQIAGWYTDMRPITEDREAIISDYFHGFNTTGSEEDVEKRVMALYKSRTERESNDGSGGKSLQELVQQVAGDSADDACGTASAFTKIEGVTTANQTLQQEVASSFLLEATDKTRAGEGETAPLNAILNIMNKAEATTAPGIMSLFTNTPVEQSDTLVQKVSAQVHGIDSQIAATVNDNNYRECIYEGNTDASLTEKKGAIVTISSIFQTIGEAIKTVADSVKNFVFKAFGINGGDAFGGVASADTVTAALSNVVSEFDEMKEQKLLTGDDTAMLGEAIASASERRITQKAQSGGLVLGTPESTKLTYRAQQEIIAENAEYDQRNKSPFDVSSRYTFLGSLAYSLMPFALSSQNFSITSTTANIGSAISDSLVALLPTSFAVGETQISTGDCVLSNNLGAASNPHCISYRNPDLSMVNQTAPQIFDTVANLRFDEAGYVYGTDGNATVQGDSDASASSGATTGAEVKVVVFALGTNNRGNGVYGGGADQLTWADIESLHNAVGEDTHVILVTNLDTAHPEIYNNNNNLLKQAGIQFPNWQTLRWDENTAANSSITEWPSEWWVHPDTESDISNQSAPGHQAWIQMIKGAVEATGASGSEIAIIGDSITNMTTSGLEAAFPGAYVHGVDGRTWQTALSDEASILAKTKSSGNQNVSGSGSTAIGKGSRKKNDPDWGDGPLNAEENGLSAHWGDKYNAALAKTFDGVSYHYTGQPNGCESDWQYETITVLVNGSNVTVRQYNFDLPTEWSYSRYTNFEYEGYESGWHNRKRSGSAGIERAQNTVDPGGCLLDIKIDSAKQPVVNQNGALNMFLLTAGQRSSEWGVADDSNLQIVSRIDFTKGRLHPCVVGAEEICKGEPYASLEWTGSVTDGGKPSDNLMENTARSMYMSPWIGGSAFVLYNGDLSTLDFMESTVQNNNRYQDATRSGDWFWNEMKWYQAFVIVNEWMENIGKINTSTATLAVKDYYKENPFDNSYEGIIARRSGLSKEDVVAVLDLMDYMEFLAQYDPTNLYPLPAPESEKLQYDGDEVVVIAERIITTNAVVYDELRNRTVAA